MIHEEFYKELGKLLYAFAVSDGMIQQREKKEVNSSILENLELYKPGNSFPENDFLLVTKLSMQNCILKQIPKKAAVQSFINFFEKNTDRISMHERDIAEKLIHRLSSAYHGINKEELLLLETVHNVLKKK